ncbi:unnamed protein product [Rotaria socialis]|nr:unnamed protein product [Rotaria socialis]
MEWPDALYHKLNAALRNKCRESLPIWFSYLKLFLTALFKLPDVEGEVLWRGIKKRFEDYKSGTHVAWWAFSSCTQSLSVLESNTYLGTTNTRTLFSIQAYNGKNIRNHSYYQNEDEILLLPGTYFQVVDQINPSPDLHIVQLKQVEPEQKLLGEPFKLKRALPISVPVSNAHDNSSKAVNTNFAQSIDKKSAPPTQTKITFTGIPHSEERHGDIPESYAGFIWPNMTYMEQKYSYRVEPNLIPLFDRYTVVAFTVRLHGSPTIIKRGDGMLFTINCIEISALAQFTQIIFRGLISGEKVYKKRIDFTKFILTKVDLNWNGIDALELTSANVFAVHSITTGVVNAASTSGVPEIKNKNCTGSLLLERKITFTSLSRTEDKCDDIPNPYFGFIWPNMTYMDQKYSYRVEPNLIPLFDRYTVVAFTVRLHGSPTIIKNADGKLFTVNCIEISALAQFTQIIFRGLISGEKVYKKRIDFTKFILTKVDLNWNGIDALELTSANVFAVHSMTVGIPNNA